MRSTIRPRAVLVATLAVLVGATGLLAAPASAGLGSLTFSMSPTSGPPSTTVSFSSITDCSVGADTAIIANTPTPSDADVLASAPVDVELGNWSLTYDIPADAAPGVITFWAFCVGTPINQAALSDATILDTYQPQDFTVTGSGTTTPTTAPPTTGTTVANTVWLDLDNTTYQQGATMLMDTGGWMPGAEVGIVVFSDPTDLGVALADSLGSLQHNWTIPANFPVGSHTVTLTGLDLAGSIVTISAPFNVTALAGALTTTTKAAAVISSGSLPATGITPYTLPLTVIGGLLAIGGVALVALDRQRKAGLTAQPVSQARPTGADGPNRRGGPPDGRIG